MRAMEYPNSQRSAPTTSPIADIPKTDIYLIFGLVSAPLRARWCLGISVSNPPIHPTRSEPLLGHRMFANSSLRIRRQRP